jgi:hypothetical protein
LYQFVLTYHHLLDGPPNIAIEKEVLTGCSFDPPTLISDPQYITFKSLEKASFSRRTAARTHESNHGGT